MRAMNDCYKLLLLVCGLYLFLCVMSDNNVTVDINGKKVPLSQITRPHNVVVGLMRSHVAQPQLLETETLQLAESDVSDRSDVSEPEQGKEHQQPAAFDGA